MMLSDVWRLSLWRLSVCLSRTSGLSREQSGLEVTHVSDSNTTFKVKKVKDQGHQAALFGCSSNYIIYMDDTIFYATAQSQPLPVDHEYSWHKARWAPQA